MDRDKFRREAEETVGKGAEAAEPVYFWLYQSQIPLYIKDLNVWLDDSVEALKKFGRPLSNDGIATETFTRMMF